MLIESGKTLGKSVPVVEERIVKAAVAAAHDRDRVVIAHALTIEATRQTLAAGADGFAHLFINGPRTPDLIEAFRAGGAFLTPTLSLLASLTGQQTGADLAADSRVTSRLPGPWLDNLGREFNTVPAGNFDAALAAVKAMHAAGVPILAGSDANRHFGALGMAHGASLHGELRLLVPAGLTPTEALRVATSVPATMFGLYDRGRITPGARGSAAGRRRSHHQDCRHPVDQARVVERNPGGPLRSQASDLVTSGGQPPRSTATRSAAPDGSDRTGRRVVGSSRPRPGCCSVARARRRPA